MRSARSRRGGMMTMAAGTGSCPERSKRVRDRSARCRRRLPAVRGTASDPAHCLPKLVARGPHLIEINAKRSFPVYPRGGGMPHGNGDMPRYRLYLLDRHNGHIDGVE